VFSLLRVHASRQLERLDGRPFWLPVNHPEVGSGNGKEKQATWMTTLAGKFLFDNSVFPIALLLQG
jgi:hypothetical protein